MKAIISHETKCTGCQYCEVICSFKHTNTFGYRYSVVRVLKDEERFLYRPMHCTQCDDTPCIDACPEDAISKDDQGGGLAADPSRCSGCGSCLKACPSGIPRFHPESGLALFCDLCRGNPLCVEFCPTGALELVSIV